MPLITSITRPWVKLIGLYIKSINFHLVLVQPRILIICQYYYSVTLYNKTEKRVQTVDASRAESMARSADSVALIARRSMAVSRTEMPSTRGVKSASMAASSVAELLYARNAACTRTDIHTDNKTIRSGFTNVS